MKNSGRNHCPECGTCEGGCPMFCISMKPLKERFLFFTVADKSRDIKCSSGKSICHTLNPQDVFQQHATSVRNYLLEDLNRTETLLKQTLTNPPPEHPAT